MMLVECLCHSTFPRSSVLENCSVYLYILCTDFGQILEAFVTLKARVQKKEADTEKNTMTEYCRKMKPKLFIMISVIYFALSVNTIRNTNKV